MSKDLYLSDQRYILALKRIKALILDGEELVTLNSDTIGNKYLHCSWGLCSINLETWPDPEDHLWPNEFVKFKRIAPKYRKPSHMCPMDKRKESDGNGCFYTCSIFQSKSSKRPTREETVTRYNNMINSIID